MTTFHESLKSLISDFEKFLVETLKKEKLSSSSKDHKQQILDKISQLREEYPALRPDDFIINKSRQDLDKVDDESTRTGGSSNADSAEDPYSDQGIPDLPASDLKDATISGYLEKKQKKGLLNTGKLQKRYCAVKGDIFYYYEREKDKKQKGAFRLTGYEFKPSPDLVKDQSKKDLCFELVGGEKRVYQFVAPSKDDFENWRKVLLGASYTGDIDYDDGDLYEPIEPEPEPIKSPKPKDNEITEDDFYSAPDEESAKINQEEPTEDDIYEDTGNVDGPQDSPRSPNTSKPDDLEQDEEYVDTANPTPPVPDRPLPRPPPPPPDSKPPEVPGRTVGHGRVPNLPPPPIPTEGSASSDSLPRPPPAIDLPPIPTEPKKKKVLPRDQDFENLYYGMWDCKGDGPDELSFSKGDVILIINRDFDDKKWWVGELEGKYGLVPKNYLTGAYTPATA